MKNGVFQLQVGQTPGAKNVVSYESEIYFGRGDG